MMRVDAWSWSSASAGQSGVPTRVTPQELLRYRATNSVPASPASYVAFAGFSQMLVYPTPDSTATLTIYYVPVPTEMSDGTHDPSLSTYGGIPVVFHDAIELYCLHKLADYDDDQSSAQGQRYHDQYDQRIKEINRWTKGKASTSMRAVVNSGRRVPRYHDNSIY